MFHQLQDIFLWSYLLFLQGTQQISPIAVFSDHIEEVLEIEHIIEFNNINMIHFLQDVYLGNECLFIFWVHYFFLQYFDGSELARLHTFAFIDTPKAPFSNFLQEVVKWLDRFLSDFIEILSWYYHFSQRWWNLFHIMQPFFTYSLLFIRFVLFLIFIFTFSLFLSI